MPNVVGNKWTSPEGWELKVAQNGVEISAKKKFGPANILVRLGKGIDSGKFSLSMNGAARLTIEDLHGLAEAVDLAHLYLRTGAWKEKGAPTP